MNPCVFIVFSFLLLIFQTNELVGEGDVKKKCFDVERRALLDFKAPLQDPDGSLSTWTAQDHDCCAWEGVYCDKKTGHVAGLGFYFVDSEIGTISSFSGLVGEISHSLVNLTYLNHLDLSYNSFHGTIPTFIGSLTELRYLSLKSNNLSGTIPRSIGSLTKLEHLYLSNNSFYGTIPPEFGNLTNLQELYLEDVGSCRVENLEWLSHLSHLEVLYMDGISLAKENQWIDVILSLPELLFLSLDECELSQVMYPYSSFLNSSSSILSLSLANNNLNSSMYRWLFHLISINLISLDLSYNKLDGIPKYLGNLCGFESLNFGYNSAVVKFPDFLNNLSGCTWPNLQDLYASHSKFTGSVSDNVIKFSYLSYLDLSNNQLNGTISEKLWELPILTDLDLSSNYLRGAISKNIGMSNFYALNLSKNLLEGVPSTDHVSNLSTVESVDMSSCKLGPHFPKWIQTLKSLNHLDISNNGISDTIPLGFWDMWSYQLQYANLSSNNISGEVPDLSSSFAADSVIDLNSNSISGPITNVSSRVILLNLSRNKFSGGISFLCHIVDGLLEFLDLSHNNFTGHLPECLWNFKRLEVLNLGHNDLFGRIPSSIGCLIKLEVLYLYKNGFSGELPLSLKNCTSLNFLNLGANRFSGDVPVWIGENLLGLYVLILRSNNFFGTIPLPLCQLSNLQILDLSMNHLHGAIPTCLNNLTRMVQQGFLPPPNVHIYTISWVDSRIPRDDSIDKEYVDHAMIDWQGDEREFSRNLGLLKSIDLSSNNLTGNIPYEITNLSRLISLNLSKNALLGEIPWNIGQMQNLVALDVSRNLLSGGLPSSMTQMHFLGYLDVSSNNLSGKIPSSTQLQSFAPARYDGNAELCGPPLTKKCPGDEEPNGGGKSGDDGEDRDELWGWFYIGGATGFVIGFWIACGALLLNHRGRHAFFHFYDIFRGWAYVKVVVFVLKLQRARHT